jgi:hypothetical protein
MKSILLMILIFPLFISHSFAKKSEKNKKLATSHNYESTYFKKRKDARRECNIKLAEMMSTVESKLGAVYSRGYEFECREVIYESKTQFDRDGNFLSSSRMWGAVDHVFTIGINAYCVPRSLREKQVYAMAMRCEQNPTEACFQDSVLDKIDALATTKITYDHSGLYCKL